MITGDENRFIKCSKYKKLVFLVNGTLKITKRAAYYPTRKRLRNKHIKYRWKSSMRFKGWKFERVLRKHPDHKWERDCHKDFRCTLCGTFYLDVHKSCDETVMEKALK